MVASHGGRHRAPGAADRPERLRDLSRSDWLGWLGWVVGGAYLLALGHTRWTYRIIDVVAGRVGADRTTAHDVGVLGCGALYGFVVVTWLCLLLWPTSWIPRSGRRSD